MYYRKQNQGAEIYFCLFQFSFFLSLTPMYLNIEIIVKDFSGTTNLEF